MRNEKNLRRINEYLEKVNALDIKIYDLEGESALFDQVIIATVDVTRQSQALVALIDKDKKESLLQVKNVNGEGTNWTLIDLCDIVLNIFTFEGRKEYDLDQLFANKKQISLDGTPVSNDGLNVKYHFKKNKS